MHSFPPPRSKGKILGTLLGVVVLSVVGFYIASFLSKIIIAVVSFVALPAILVAMIIGAAVLLDKQEGKRLQDYRDSGGRQ